MSGLRAWLRLSAAALLLQTAAVQGAPPTDPAGVERQVAAAFVFNFVKFTSWPREALPDTGKVINISVVGDDSLAVVLDLGTRGKLAQGRRLVVTRASGTQDAGHPHVVVVGPNAGKEMAGLMSRFRAEPVLTISRDPGFVEKGGAIQLIRDGERMTFDVNYSAVERAGITISSKVLGLARKVHYFTTTGG